MPIASLVVHLFLPHHTNNHRPKTLHIDALFSYVLLFAVFNLILRFGHAQAPEVLGYATNIHVEQLLAATNAKRQAVGLSLLTLNDKLSQAAQAKAVDMFAKNYWAHNSPAGATPWEFISGAGYQYVVAGENLAKNFSDSQGVVAAWMASPTHRENILKPAYREIGFAVVNGILQGEETTLVVQLFGASRQALSAPPPRLPVAQITTAPQSVEVTAQAAQAEQAPVLVRSVAPEQSPSIQTVASAFVGVTKNPKVDIARVSRELVFLFFGIIITILAVDAWIVGRKNIVRVAGHNIGHILFLAAIVFAGATMGRGTLL